MASIAVTYEDIVSKNPCNPPSIWIAEGWSGTLLDLYEMENIEPYNKVMLAVWFLSSEELQGFSEWLCAQSASENVQKLSLCRPVDMAIWFASKKADQVGLSYADQVQYLKQIELARD